MLAHFLALAFFNSQPGRPFMLDHYIFTSEGGWKAAESMRHPTQLPTDKSDYAHLKLKVPNPAFGVEQTSNVVASKKQTCFQ